MEMSINSKDLNFYVVNQCNTFFSDNNQIKPDTIICYIELALDKVKFCFQHINLPYYKKKGSLYFNHLNGDHYCIFLCYLTRIIFLETGDEQLASKVFLLNKLLFGIDAFYKIELPDIFLVVHPIGTILGRADYKNKLVVYQGVTVGATTEGIYPSFSENSILYSNCSIIGNCKLGNNLVMGANSSILNMNIEENTTVLGSFPNNRFIINKNLINHYFI